MVRQLAVFIENKPGSLAEVTGVLAEAGINIESIMVEGMHEFGVARLQVDPLRKAEKALQDAGFQFHTGEVVVVRLSNKPGELHRVISRLAKAKINVESVFGTTGHMGEAEMVLRVEDADRAKDVLGIKKGA